MNDEIIINKVNFWKSCISDKINSILISQARSKLEKELAKIIIIANNHLNKGKNKGDQVFISLWKQSILKIQDFCIYCNKKNPEINTSELETQIFEQLPALTDLKAYTIPEQKINSIFKIIGIPIIIGITLILIGISAGIINYAFHLIH